MTTKSIIVTIIRVILTGEIGIAILVENLILQMKKEV